MKIFVLDKRIILLMSLMLGFIVILLPFSINGLITTSVSNTPLPIYSVDKDNKNIAITFDSAWGNEDLDEIIKVLNQYECSATFFVVGDFIDRFPESVKMLSDSGHEVANHSNSHAHFNALSKEAMIADMNKCDEKIEKITGKKNAVFRAPYGEYNSLLVNTCKETNRYCIQWDVDSLDWKGLTADQMEKRIMEKVKSGSILLFHNGTKNTVNALPQILNKLKNEGYKFTTVSNLIFKENYYMDNAGKQISY